MFAALLWPSLALLALLVFGACWVAVLRAEMRRVVFSSPRRGVQVERPRSTVARAAAVSVCR
jgi:hypothetical protein